MEQLADMRDNGVDIEAHSATHQDLREGHTITLASPGGKKTRTKLTGAQYEQWVQNESSRLQATAEQRLGIKVNCFCRAVWQLQRACERTRAERRLRSNVYCYGQPITFTSSLDSLGRYAIEANKPKVFEDALKMIGTSTGGAAAVGRSGRERSRDSTSRRRNSAHCASSHQSQPQRHRPDRTWQCPNARERPWRCASQL